MKRSLWLLVVPFASFACTEETGSAGQATTASTGPNPSASVPDADEPAQTSSSPSSTTPPTMSSSAAPGSGESPIDPEPEGPGSPEPEDPSAPEPEDPGAPEPDVQGSPEPEPPGDPEPSFEPNGGSGGAPGDGPSPAMSGAGGEPQPDGGSGAMAGAEPEPLEGCESGPLDLPIDGCAPEFEETGDFYADCVERINQLRWECQCLPPLERWVEGESCADQHAQYDYEQDEPHAGISDGICENGGGSQNECPDYNPNFDVINFCLQQMWDEGPGEDFQAHGHYINMSSTGVTKVACGLYVTPEGDFWSVQNFTR